MPNVCFFSFTEPDRPVVLTIKGRAINSLYPHLNFRVKDLLRRWATENDAVIKQAITKAMTGTSRTIVFVGERTHRSTWVAHEIDRTIVLGRKLYAIRLRNTFGAKPTALTRHGIHLHTWSEATLQDLATR